MRISTLKKKIRESGIKHKKIAEMAGISTVYLRKILSGERKPENLSDIVTKITDKISLN